MSLDPRRVEELIEGYLHGTLSARDLAELDQELCRDPAAARALMAAVADESLLREIFGGADRLKALPDPSNAPARPGRAFRRALRPRPRVSRRWAALASSAAIVLIGLGVLFFRGAGGPKAIAEVVRVQGAVRRTDGQALAAGAGLSAGQGLETAGASGKASIRFSDGTLVDLAGETRIARIEENGGGRSLQLDSGALSVETSRPMKIQTPQAEARVLGTRFSISADRDATRLEVTKGKVRITRREDGAHVVVEADHFAVVATGVDLDARPIKVSQSPGAALAAKMASRSWASAPATSLRPVAPDPARFPKIQGNVGPRGIMESWSGGAFDGRRNRLVVWGGGSTNYRGNEIYAFDVQALRWERLTDPTPDPVDGGPVNPDGTPNIRDTFNGLAYIVHADLFFALGGSLSGSAARLGADQTWTFDFTSKRWTDRKPSGQKPRTGEGDCCAYDPATRRVWYFDTNNVAEYGLYSYDFDANRWQKHTSDHLARHTLAVDARRGRLVAVGDGDVSTFDLRGGNPVRRVWKTSGGDRFIAFSNPGLDYDSGRDRIVGWSGGAVYTLDPETGAWTADDAPGAPAPTPNGIYGRWRYVPALGVFVLATTIDQDVRFYRP